MIFVQQYLGAKGRRVHRNYYLIHNPNAIFIFYGKEDLKNPVIRQMDSNCEIRAWECRYLNYSVHLKSVTVANRACHLWGLDLWLCGSVLEEKKQWMEHPERIWTLIKIPEQFWFTNTQSDRMKIIVWLIIHYTETMCS